MGYSGTILFPGHHTGSNILIRSNFRLTLEFDKIPTTDNSVKYELVEDFYQFPPYIHVISWFVCFT